MMLSFFSRLTVWLILLLLGIFSASCVSRLAQPALSGYLFNYDNEAIVGARVNDTYTNEDGYFSIDEQRYLRFLPVEIIQLEAPPVFYEIAIAQAGYEPIHKKFMQQHGGAQRKGAKHQLDTIYLKRNEEPMDLSTLLYQKWNFHANSNLDTLYGYNSNYRLGSITADRPLMPNWKLKFEYRENSPTDTVWSTQSYSMRTLYAIHFEREGTYAAKLKRTYENTWRHRLCKGTVEREFHPIPADSLYTKGDFELRSDTLFLNPSLSTPPSIYHIDFADRDVLILTRISE